jgi:hypothetical protein
MGHQQIAIPFDCFGHKEFADVQANQDPRQFPGRIPALKPATIVGLLQTWRKNLVQYPDRFLN